MCTDIHRSILIKYTSHTNELNILKMISKQLLLLAISRYKYEYKYIYVICNILCVLQCKYEYIYIYICIYILINI